MNERYDVLILGAGFAGTVLATILGRQGLKVLVLEEGEHPKFAIGESTTPEFTLRMRLAAHRFDVPELAHLTNFYAIRDNLGSSHGVKRSFSFLYHREGREQTPRESLQVPTLHPPIGPDAHLFRQDVDAYYLAVAIRYGVTIVQKARVTHLDVDGKEVCARTEKHGEFRARYLVDAGGMRSPLAAALDLRENPTRYQTRSRAIYTHFIDVRPYDRVGGPRQAHRLPYPHSQSTLHHLFDGGWMWVIPFNNHPRATNPLCSVGVLLDVERFPRRDDLSPEAELLSFIRRFPSVARQFERAEPVRNTIATGRLQYSSRRVVGERWCLTSHAGAFIDPLFSSGLPITISTITLLADALLKAFRDDDFSLERFAAVEEFVQQSFGQFDRVVSASYVSFRDFALWNAWGRIYLTGVLFGALSPMRCYLKYLDTGDRAALEAIDRVPYRPIAGSGFAAAQKIFDRGFEEIMRVRSEGKEPRQTARDLFAILRDVDFVPPAFRLADPEQHAPSPFTLLKMARDLPWYQKRSPQWVRDTFFDWSPSVYVKYTMKGVLSLLGTSIRRSFDPLREAFSSWHPHW
ncbi:MAG TPA: tryptophan 7-halogenase [Gemmataceae bacterium]|jgi:FADH2 O2-dependent halogenase